VSDDSKAGASREATRLERLWAGGFGDAYVQRNPVRVESRARFWKTLLTDHPIRSVLEVGCGQGGNLSLLGQLIDPADLWGIDVNAEALSRARVNAPGANLVLGIGRRLPFRDGLADLAFTVGVLIHQPESTLPLVMSEIVRCSRRYVLWVEYFGEQTEEVPYHGEAGTLYRRDYGRLYGELFPELIVRGEGFLGPDEGFDRGTWQLLENP
jgi:pseudaminic acid biosynthesis-associated methylase